MNNTTLRVIAMITLIMAGIGMAAGQGLYWESVTKVPAAGGEEIHTASYYRPHMFKQTSDHAALVFRLDKEMFYQIDNEAKEYAEMTFEEMEGFAKRASGEMQKQMEEMKKQLEAMPAEQRESMKKMMESHGMVGNPNAKIDATRTDEKKTMFGYPCVKYVLKDDGKEFGSIWTTTGVPGYNGMQKDMKEFSRQMASQLSMRGGQLAAAMEKVEGFPIQTTIGDITTTVTKVEKKNVATSEFDIPAGYTKVNPEELMERRSKQDNETGRE
jgi:hypothetical protein